METLLFGNGAISLDQIDPYQGLELAPKAAFDDLTRLAACICKTPIALLCFIDARRGWVQSQVGLDSNSTEAYLALCAQTLLQLERWDSRLLMVEDVLADPHWANHEGVTSQANIGFYVGVPFSDASRTHTGHISSNGSPAAIANIKTKKGASGVE